MSLHPTLNYYFTREDKFFTCPYDKSHKILRDRLSQHLMKCRKAHLAECRKTGRKPAFDICRWNSNHHIQNPEITAHEQGCPDRESFLEHVVYHANPNWTMPGPVPVEIVVPRENATGQDEPEEEDWGNDSSNVGVFNPLPRIENNGLVYNPQGLTRSQRRAYRAQLPKLRERREQENMVTMMQDRQPVPGTSASFAPNLLGSSSGTDNVHRGAIVEGEEDYSDLYYTRSEGEEKKAKDSVEWPSDD